nr:hypothetical protein GAFPHCNK_00555 [[Clostridium] scindens]
MSGIFNDVYLLNRPNQCIYDYYITTTHTDKKQKICIRLYLKRKKRSSQTGWVFVKFIFRIV